jgi:negative regulator of replication initiation
MLQYTFNSYICISVKTIEIDDEIYSEIERRAEGFGQTPNAVLRKILGVAKTPDWLPLPKTQTASSLDEFLCGGEYLSATTADERYLKLISWLMRNHVELQSTLDGFRVRKRVLFSKDAKKIENSAKGVTAKPIPGVDIQFFAMVTLDNRQKRKIISRVFTRAGYPETAVEQAIKTLPDSGINRGGTSRLLAKTLADYA